MAIDIREALAFAKQMKDHFAVFEHAVDVLELVADGEQVAKEVAERARVAQEAAETELRTTKEDKLMLVHDLVAPRDEIPDLQEQRAAAHRDYLETKAAAAG